MATEFLTEMTDEEWNCFTDEIVSQIKDWFELKAGYKSLADAKAVIGISGGKDSSVVAALCAKALGPENVYGVMMPNGIQKDINYSEMLVDHLGIKKIVININSAVERVLTGLYNNNLGVTSQVETNLPARIRMATLYSVAASVNGRVIGTGNAAERAIGYTTLWGDSASDFNPIAGLFVDEVIKVGETLGLPTVLTRKPPDDGMCGKTDEDNLGFTYNEVKCICCGRDNIVSKEHVDAIRTKMKQNMFKRKIITIPTVDLSKFRDLLPDGEFKVELLA